MPPVINPLTGEHLICCNHVLGDTPQALELADACLECDFPAADLRAKLQAQHDQAAKIKAKFFTTSP
jgi:hypothetical protein